MSSSKHSNDFQYCVYNKATPNIHVCIQPTPNGWTNTQHLTDTQCGVSTHNFDGEQLNLSINTKN